MSETEKTEEVKNLGVFESLVPNSATRDEIQNHLQTNPGLAVWAYGYDSNPDITHLSYGGCHLSAQSVISRAKIRYFASITGYTSASYMGHESEPIQRYAEWINGKDSPYYPLHEGEIELLRNSKGLIYGFIVGKKAISKPAFLYNFLIANRMARDHYNIIKNWYDLQEIGISPFRAFVLAPYFQRDGKNWIRSSNYWSGSHTPFREKVSGMSYDANFTSIPIENQKFTKIFDLERLRKGDYKEDARNVRLSSEGWLTTDVGDKKPISLMVKTTGVTRTRFSQLLITNTDLILGIANQIPN